MAIRFRPREQRRDAGTRGQGLRGAAVLLLRTGCGVRLPADRCHAEPKRIR